MGQEESAEKVDVKPHDLERTFDIWFLQANLGYVRELAEFMGLPDFPGDRVRPLRRETCQGGGNEAVAGRVQHARRARGV